MKALVKSLWISITVCIAMTSLPAFADELMLLSGAHLPYSIPDEQRGVHSDVVKEVLALSGHDVKVTFVPFIKVEPAIHTKQYDIYVPVFVPNLPSNMYVSLKAEFFQNGAVTLINQPPIKSYQAFKDKRLIAFRGAKMFLGQEYATAVEYAAEYRETDMFLNQLMALEKGNADISIGDINLAAYAAVQYPFLAPNDLRMNPIFEPIPYHFVFKDEAIRDQFDIGFQKLKENGRYQEIMNSYIVE
ncbi:substrate-binding periplasmic protein [Curvivirga sp.]|uniref:substrate-binding periplasmic protein n=1 Tax=Curvivirga sp. TaxID=2856848 RepID=UPI003B5C5433